MNILCIFIAAFLFVIAYKNPYTDNIALAHIFSLWIFLSQLEKQVSLKHKLFTTFSFVIIIYYLNLSWTALSFTSFAPDLAGYKNLVDPFFAIILLPHFILFCFIFHFTTFSQQKFFKNPLFIASILCLLETYIPQPVEIKVGHPWIQFSPYLYLAKLGGATFYSFITYLISSYLCFSKSPLKIKGLKVGLGLFVIIIIEISFSSLHEDVLFSSKPLNIKVVQGGFAQYQGKEKEFFKEKAIVEKKHFDLSLQSLSKDEYKFIIWGENSYQYFSDETQNLSKGLFQNKLFKDYDINLLVAGGLLTKEETPSLMNTVYLLDNKNQIIETYSKHKLMPIGEDLVIETLGSIFKSKLVNFKVHRRGKEYTLFKLKNDFTFITPICYEIIFTGYIREYLNKVSQKPDFIVTVTNEAWFKGSIEFEQHNLIARWRALEYNIPVIRAAATGITSYILPSGVEALRIDPFEYSSIDIKLEKRQPLITYYQVLGNIPLVLFLIIVNFVVFFRYKKGSLNV